MDQPTAEQALKEMEVLVGERGQTATPAGGEQARWLAAVRGDHKLQPLRNSNAIPYPIPRWKPSGSRRAGGSGQDHSQSLSAPPTTHGSWLA
jgi:hypothetical protein